jgi:hypothetical protein
VAKFNGQLLALTAIGITAEFVAALDGGRIWLGHGLNIQSIGSVASG